MQWFSTLPTFSSLLGIPEPNEAPSRQEGLCAHQAATLELVVGEFVEYNSASLSEWIPAKVVGKNPDGTFDLDCKPQVSVLKIRLPAWQRPEYQVGDMVDYLSESQGSWIPARVEGFDSVSCTYRLDCKGNVPPGKLRARRYSLPPVLDKAPMLTRPSNRRLSPILERSDEVDMMLSSRAEGSVPPSRTSLSSLPPSHGVTQEAGGSSSSQQRLNSETPVQLVKALRRADGGWRFEVDEEALQVLAGFTQKLAVCTICGPYRSGKSFLLNALMGLQQGFKVGSTTRACTEGLWMRCSSQSVGGSTLLFMDCEGFGSTDSDKTRDAMLMSLCLLISSVFLLNTKGVLNEGLFNALSLVCQLARHVEGSSAAPEQRPALLWLLRDFVLDIQNEAGQPISSDEYLEGALRARPQAGMASTRSQASQEVRDSLLHFFPRRHCHTLVQPVIEESALQNLAELPYDDLRPEFRQGLEALRAQLVDLAKLKPSMLPSGLPTDGPALAKLLRRLVGFLNEGKALSLTNAWDQVQHSSCESLSNELLLSARAHLRQIRLGGEIPGLGRGLPLPDGLLTEALHLARGRLRQAWRERAVGDEAVKQQYWQDLKRGLQEEERSLVQLNEKMAADELQVPLMAWEEWLKDGSEANPSDPRSEALAVLIRRGLPHGEATRSACEALAAARAARLRSDNSIRLLRTEIESRSTSINEARKYAGDTQIEQTRELGRLQGQVEVMQDQLREAGAQERLLREKLFEVEERFRKEHAKSTQALAKCDELEAAQTQHISEPAPRGEPPRGKQPKCQCNVM